MGRRVEDSRQSWREPPEADRCAANEVAHFFLAFLPQFVAPARGNPARPEWLQRLTGGIFVALGLRLALAAGR